MSSWVAIDFETANEHRGSACSVGMTAVDGQAVTGTWSTLIQPPPALGRFDPYNVRVHGIQATDVVAAPGWKAALAEILSFADGRPLVAHNAGFDFGVIRAACDTEGIAWPELRYTCSQVVARRTWKLLSYGLPYCMDAAGHAFTDHHQAGVDSRASAEIMLSAMREAGTTTLDELLDKHRIRWGSMTADRQWHGSRYRGESRRDLLPVPSANPAADPEGALYGLTVCLTGTLTSMKRTDAFDRLAEAGAQPVKTVTRKTDILVSATQTQLKPGDTLSGKLKEARALLDAGWPIEVVDEDEFLRRLGS
ncbi:MULTISPECIES: exonuclease domain-containing protein [unclassified Streptomyces]|uniref:exonuclease domain-containing protein n=1 Tax=unclassified Streptomyces TaxID=2593676 RepID=UPI003800BF31